MRKTILITCLLLTAFLCGCGGDKQKQRQATNGSIKVAAFNIQVFGQSKRSKPEVMNVLTMIAREFDVMLVQEIRDSSETTANFYLDEINDMDGPDYAYVKSPRLGRTSMKEAYAYYYNTSTVECTSDYVWDDTGDVFEREPYVATFRSGNFDFTLVGIHARPDDAESEISELAGVYLDVLAKAPGERDLIILGDFNADGSYFDEDAACLLKDGKFSWTITNDMDTMTKTDWTYDRIVMTDATVGHEYDRGDVFYFDSVLGIVDQKLIQDVSDHFPVYAVFRTDLVDDDGDGI
jgi:deoxyribonuclease-1-like protein